MEYLQEGKRVRYNPYRMKKDRHLNSGQEGDVYHIGKEAIKFYKPLCPNKIRLNRETAILLSKINTKRILTPNYILQSKKRILQGYSTTYIEDLGIENILLLELQKLKDELTFLKEDVTVLSDHFILLGDLTIENTSFHQGIYLFDPGSYQHFPNLVQDTIYGMNMDQMNEYLLMEFLFHLNHHQTKKLNESRQFIKNIFHDYLVKEKYPDLIEYLKEDMQEENILEYIKKKKREFKEESK